MVDYFLVDKNICFECGNKKEVDHHVVPKSKTGTKTVPLCHRCHGKIHSKNLMKMQNLSKQKHKKMKEEGFYVGGVKKYGYDVVDGKYVTNEDEQKIIEMIREWRVLGMSIMNIKRKLEKGGIKTKRGKDVWNYYSVRNLVKRLEK